MEPLPATVAPRHAVSIGVSTWRKAMLVVAAVAVAATLLSLSVVQRIADSYRLGLDTTASGATVTGQVAESGAQIASDVAALTRTTSDALGQGERTLRASAISLEQIATASRTNLADGLEGTATVAERAASLIETIERFIPGDSDSLAEDLREVADGLEPAPGQLRDLGVTLEDAALQLRATTDDITTLVPQMATLAGSVRASQASLEDVAELSREVERRAAAERTRADLDIWLLRLLCLVVGISVAAGALWARAHLADTESLRGNP
jgi:ABC-type transporter Mla subunit MlaD